jgi:hypothetical protein
MSDDVNSPVWDGTVPMLTALFVGGPLDGQYRDIMPAAFARPPEDEYPAKRVVIDYQSPEHFRPQTATYVRSVNPADTGPLWLYHWESEGF